MRTRSTNNPAAATRQAILLAAFLLSVWLAFVSVVTDAAHAGPPVAPAETGIRSALPSAPNRACVRAAGGFAPMTQLPLASPFPRRPSARRT